MHHQLLLLLLLLLLSVATVACGHTVTATDVPVQRLAPKHKVVLLLRWLVLLLLVQKAPHCYFCSVEASVSEAVLL
jgi:hypothetical protein